MVIYLDHDSRHINKNYNLYIFCGIKYTTILDINSFFQKNLQVHIFKQHKSLNLRETNVGTFLYYIFKL